MRYLDLGVTANIDKISIKWRVDAYAKRAKITADGKEIINRSNTGKNTPKDGWSDFEEIGSGRKIEIELSNGQAVGDYHFGIRALSIYGKPSSPSSTRDIIKTAFMERTHLGSDLAKRNLQLMVLDNLDRHFFH